MTEKDDFFQQQYFNTLNERLVSIEGKLNDIQSKVVYMYAFAAGVGFVFSFLWSYIQSKFIH